MDVVRSGYRAWPKVHAFIKLAASAGALGALGALACVDSKLKWWCSLETVDSKLKWWCSLETARAEEQGGRIGVSRGQMWAASIQQRKEWFGLGGRAGGLRRLAYGSTRRD